MNLHHLTTALGLEAILAALLLIACVTDWRQRIIPHWLNITIALLAPLMWWAMGWHSWALIWPQLLLCLGTLIVFIVFQMIGAMGGGDVKMLGALALWWPWPQFLGLLILMSILGGVLTLILWAAHKIRKSKDKLEIPYGIAIAIAGLWVICEHYFNHFR